MSLHKHTPSFHSLIADETGEFEKIAAVQASGFRWLRFPVDLEKEFRVYYHQETLNILRDQTLNIFIAYFVAVISLFLSVPVSAMGMYPEIIALCSAVVLLVGAIGNSGYLERYLFWGLGGAASFCVAIVMIGVPSVLTNSMHDTAVVGSGLLICTVYALSRLRLQQAMLACFCAGLVFIAFYALIALPIDWRLLLSIYVAPNIIGITIGYFVEHRERRVFLQDKQILLEKKKLAELTEQLDALSKTDGLTGLSNRRYFDQVVDTEWERARRYQEPLGMLLIDVDHFKDYNDFYGHPAGDQVLISVASALSQCSARPSDVVARFGGEEFVILLPETSAEGCDAVAERIHKAIKNLMIPHDQSSVSRCLTVSIGVAAGIPDERASYDDMLKKADIALYKAKSSGRSCTVIYHEGMAA